MTYAIEAYLIMLGTVMLGAVVRRHGWRHLLRVWGLA